MNRFILFVLLFLFTDVYAKPPANYTATYNIYYQNAVVAKSTRDFKIDGNDCYTLTWESKTIIPLTNLGFKETSAGCYHEGLPRPNHYTFDSHEIKKNKHVSLSFDWKNKKVIDNNSKKTWEITSPQNTKDRTSILLALRQSYINQKPQLNYFVAERGKIKPFEFHLEKEETLKTKLGPLKTLKLSRTSKSGIHKSTIWLAKDLNYLIVKMLQEKEGKEVSRIEVVKQSNILHI